LIVAMIASLWGGFVQTASAADMGVQLGRDVRFTPKSGHQNWPALIREAATRLGEAQQRMLPAPPCCSSSQMRCSTSMKVSWLAGTSMRDDQNQHTAAINAAMPPRMLNKAACSVM
jgi:hypothetical protein